MNMMNSLGGAALPLVIGFILDLTWGGQMIQGVRDYSLHSYQLGITSLPICIGIALLLLPFIHETYCREQV